METEPPPMVSAETVVVVKSQVKGLHVVNRPELTTTAPADAFPTSSDGLLL